MTLSEPTFERLGPADAPEYRALMLEAYEANPEAFTSTVADRVSQPLSMWEDRLSDAPDGRKMVFGARRAGELCGVVGLEFYTRTKVRHKAKLFGIYVRENERGSGVASRLIENAIEETRRRGRSVLYLTAAERNRAAVALYRKMGFAAFGTEPLALVVDDGFVGKIHMWRRV